LKDYYFALGVNREASLVEIKDAYRKLSKKFHPDLNEGDDFFTARFRDIQEAYDILSNTVSRANYDKIADKKVEDDSHKYFQPVINHFESSKSSIGYNEEVTFSWECFNADYCELLPFGQVPNKGSKTVRLKDFEKPSMTFKLVAVNQFLNLRVEKDLTIKNATYQNIKDQIISDYEREKQSIQDLRQKSSNQESEIKNEKKEETKNEKIEEPDVTLNVVVIFAVILVFVILFLSLS
jgi:curved DNA-binding protein CbpA